MGLVLSAFSAWAIPAKAARAAASRREESRCFMEGTLLASIVGGVARNRSWRLSTRTESADTKAQKEVSKSDRPAQWRACRGLAGPRARPPPLRLVGDTMSAPPRPFGIRRAHGPTPLSLLTT